MCKHGTYSYLFFDGELEPIDSCITPLILQLMSAGIKTLSSCCEHGKDYPYVICERGTEEKLKKFGCKDVKTGWAEMVRANFRVQSLDGKIYTAEQINKLYNKLGKQRLP